MWNSKEIGLIIIFSVLNFVYTALVGQMAWFISGVPGTNLLLIIGGVVINSVALLYFKGRRWRFAIYQILFAMLSIPTFFLGVPFDVVSRLPLVIAGLVTDVFLNGVYHFFAKKKILKLWVIIDMNVYFLITPLISLIYFSVLYEPGYVSFFVNNVIILIPIIIAESTIGAVIGYNIYERLKKEAPRH